MDVLVDSVGLVTPQPVQHNTCLRVGVKQHGNRSQGPATAGFLNVLYIDLG